MSLRRIGLGIENAVASMGTSLTQEHVGHLSKFCKSCPTYDGDKAGQAATMKALMNCKNFQIDIVKLPDNMDPDEFYRRILQRHCNRYWKNQG